MHVKSPDKCDIFDPVLRCNSFNHKTHRKSYASRTQLCEPQASISLQTLI